MNLEHWKDNTLKIIQEGDYTFIMPKKHFDIWEDSHLFTIKRAASIIVLEKGKIIKNILDKAYKGERMI